MYLTFWGINEGIAQSTVIPHINILSKFNQVENIFLSSIERDIKSYKNISNGKIIHTPLESKRFKFSIIELINNFIKFPFLLRKICLKNKIDFIIVRGVCAGSIAWILHKLVCIPLYVESFEPHADYMLESKMWKKTSLKFIFQKFFENRLKKDSNLLMPVSFNYKKQLIKENINESKIDVIPCCVNLDKFSKKISDRKKIRDILKISENTVVGIYVGKFGGIYHYEKAFSIFKNCFENFKRFYLIILTPQNKNIIIDKLNQYKIPKNSHFVSVVDHSEIPKYLSASDFAFSLQKPSYSKKFLSPIKNAEYWANGLPILITNGVGDDSDIIKKNPLSGVILSDVISDSIKDLEYLISNNSTENIVKTNMEIAKNERNFSYTRNCYSKIIKAHE